MPDTTPTDTPVPTAAPTPTIAAIEVPPKPRAPAPAGGLPNFFGEALLMALLLGLAASGLAAALRKKFPTATGTLGELLVCDLCVSFWSSAALVAFWWISSALPVTKMTVGYFGCVLLAATGLAYLAVKVAGWLTGQTDLARAVDPRFSTTVASTDKPG